MKLITLSINTALLSVFLSWGLQPPPAQAWDQHQSLMPWILSASAPTFKEIIGRGFPVPCEAEDHTMTQQLIGELQLNPNSEILPTASSLSSKVSHGNCGPNTRVSIGDLLAGSSVDDPDKGIDQNLPASIASIADPNGDRNWMGGTQGFTSQGFRHMYFGGWKILSHPLSTFQIPFRAVGQSPNRVQLMAQKAKDLIKAGQIAWGTRLLGWALHYVQDLTQPFHAVQLVNLRMVPWSELFSWPPGKAFERLRKETTRIVTNFHWAYEGYTLNRIQVGDESPFKTCLSEPEKYVQINFDLKSQSPLNLAHWVSEASIELAPDLGSAELGFFGDQLMQRGVDFTANPQMIDYQDYSIRPDLNEPRKKLNQVTCNALANASLASRFLIEWAFQP